MNQLLKHRKQRERGKERTGDANASPSCQTMGAAAAAASEETDRKGVLLVEQRNRAAPRVLRVTMCE